MNALHQLYNFTRNLKYSDQIMPTIFIGHGSPMNGIENNEFSMNWHELGQSIPHPKAIIVISAHWLTKGTYITAMNQPATIHDFYGFPQALFDVNYPAPGDVNLAKQVTETIHDYFIELDHDWGLDHGTWTVTKHMFPKADIPTLQLSIDFGKPLDYHYQLATQLKELRKKGVLILGSGNMVHNLRMIAWDKMNDNFGYDWALEINEILKNKIVDHNFKDLINYENLNPSIKLAIPSLDHYIPMIYNIGLKSDKDDLLFFNDSCVAGSLTMTSFMYYQ